MRLRERREIGVLLVTSLKQIYLKFPFDVHYDTLSLWLAMVNVFIMFFLIYN